MGLQVINLRTAPERIYLFEDRLSRCRWQIVAATEPVHTISDYALHMLAVALGAHLAQAPYDGVRVELLVQPLGRPMSETVVQYRLQIGEQLVWATLTFTAWTDAALDGEATTWQVVEASKSDILRCLAALAYATLTDPAS